MPRIALVSDTHMAHAKLRVPESELLIHCGDYSLRGTRLETEDFLDWLGAQPAAHKVLVAGNHDGFAEREPELMHELARRRGVTYLDDEACTICDLRMWGSAITPAFRSMAFNRARGERIRRHWEQIPEGLDVLITHGPPKGLCDRIVVGAHVGCDDLLDIVRQRPPRLHVFGHIHEAHGEAKLPDRTTRFLNVASRRLLPVGIRAPLVLDLAATSVG